jgi:hypothetical protein
MTGFRDHWAETAAEWTHNGSWLTSLVLPSREVALGYHTLRTGHTWRWHTPQVLARLNRYTRRRYAS